MTAKTFLEIHEALLSGKPLTQAEFKADKIGLYNGLCSVWLGESTLQDNEVFQLIMPNYPERAYWADHDDISWFRAGVVYNELRQNIILFCAAMNGEL